MIAVASLLAGVLFAAAVYLLLSWDLQRIAFGFILLSNAVNLLVLAAGGLTPGAAPPLLRGDGRVMADPLPQAFILTAIVIGLGMTAFLLALAIRIQRESGSDDVGSQGRE